MEQMIIKYINMSEYIKKSLHMAHDIIVGLSATAIQEGCTTF